MPVPGIKTFNLKDFLRQDFLPQVANCWYYKRVASQPGQMIFLTAHYCLSGDADTVTEQEQQAVRPLFEAAPSVLVGRAAVFTTRNTEISWFVFSEFYAVQRFEPRACAVC